MGRMPCIDFKEIPEANVASGEQDRFELFARDFFTEIFKFEVLSEPNRGADGGKDILLAEHQTGTLSDSTVKWLVSCKHKAFYGKSVSPDDEANVSDRIEQFGADGFIGFYSTLASSGLNTRLDAYKGKYRIQVFDKEKIESYILKHKRYELFRRYFPISYSRWLTLEGKNTPSQILSSYQPLNCKVCGRDLLSRECEDHGIIGFVLNPKTDKTFSCYAACRGRCDSIMEAYYASQKIYTAWTDVNDLMIPAVFLQKIMAIINQLHSGELEFEGTGLEEFKTMLIAISQYVFRHPTDYEIVRAKELLMLPEGL